MKSIFLFKIIIACFLSKLENVFSQSIGESDQNIAFDSADLVLDYEIGGHVIQIQAFKSVKNDMIIDSNNALKYPQLNWFSIGYPRLVFGYNNKIFQFNDEGFTIYASMLTEPLKKKFVEIVKYKYHINITVEQIDNLILTDFQCSLKFYSNREKLLILGRVKHFHKFPLHIVFDAPIETKERDALIRRIERDKNNLDLHFDCQVGSHGRFTKSNIIEISADQINKLKLADELFGPAESVYVTRQQMADLASQIYTSLNIIENYQIPQTTFSIDFVNQFLQQTSSVMNAYEPLDNVLKALSPYHISDDLKADTIKNDYGKLFKIVKTGSKKHIKLDKEHYEHNKEKYSGKLGYSAKGSGYGFSAGMSINVALAKESDWANSDKSLDDQLLDLNNHEQNDIEWKIEGEKIIPKSIKVSKLLKSKFEKGIKLNRERREHYNSKLNQSITLSTFDPFLNYSLNNHVETKLDKIDRLLNEQNSKINKQISNLLEKTGEIFLFNEFKMQIYILKIKSSNLNS